RGHSRRLSRRGLRSYGACGGRSPCRIPYPRASGSFLVLPIESPMLQQALMFLLGLATLVIGADVMVRGASRLAVSFGVSPLVVGLTVVAFGTSAPEMAVSVGAALSGTPDLAIGNVVGSNIANVLLILGISALITPLLV